MIAPVKFHLWMGVAFVFLLGVPAVLLTNYFGGSNFMVYVILTPPYFITEMTVVDGAPYGSIQREVWHWLGIIGTALLYFFIGYFVGDLLTYRSKK